MKKAVTRIISVLFVVVMIFECGAAPASAAFQDFTDVKGHWGASVMERAYNDGFIEGYPNKTIGPGKYITPAQMVTILSRILKMDKSAGVSSLGLTGGEWYASHAGKAL